MKKRIFTVLISVMTVSIYSVLLASCSKTTVVPLSKQNVEVSEVNELPALRLAESITPQAGSNIEVMSEQTDESIVPEVSTDALMSSEQTDESIASEVRTGALMSSEQTDESIASEVRTGALMSSEQIADDLISHVWEGSLGDEHYSIVFASDNFARHTLTDSDGEWQGEGMHSWGLKANIITLFWEDEDLTAIYSKESDKTKLVFQDESGNVSLTLTATE